MVQYRYLTPKYCHEIREGSTLASNSSFVGTYSDILFIADEMKVKTDYNNYKKFQEDVNSGNIFLVELDEQWFIENAFDEDCEGNPFLDTKVNDFTQAPLFTCNYLSLKTQSSGAYWDEELLEEFMQTI